jgi:integrase
MLQRLIVAALESCCRRGELLALQWKDVDLAKRKLRLRAETTKTRTERVLPISARLLAVLEFAKGAFEGTLPVRNEPPAVSDNIFVN